jgi:hypothetical protein
MTMLLEHQPGVFDPGQRRRANCALGSAGVGVLLASSLGLPADRARLGR